MTVLALTSVAFLLLQPGAPPKQDISSIAAKLAAGDRVQAQQQAKELLSQASSQPQLLLALGQLLGSYQEFNLSEQAFRRAAVLLPDSFEAHFNLGLTLYRAQKKDQAPEPLRRAAELNPSSFEANYLLGVVLSESEEKREAILRLRDALALRPEHKSAAALLAVLYLDGSYYPDAIDVLLKVRAADSSDENLALLLVQAYHGNFDLNSALALARSTAAKFPASANAHFQLAYVLQLSGQFGEAEASFQKVLQIQLAHPEANLALGQWKLKTGRVAEAVKHFEKTLAAVPRNFYAHIGLAKALIGLKQHERAKERLLSVVAERPAEPIPHLLLSQIHQAEGDLERSQKERAVYLTLYRQASSGSGMSSSLPVRKPARFLP